MAGDAAAAVVGIDYPAGTEERFAFADEPIRVYAGEVTVTVRFSSDRPDVRLGLAYQACDDRTCLRPVSREVAV